MTKTPAFDALDDDDKLKILEYIRLNCDVIATWRHLKLDAAHTNPLSVYKVANEWLNRVKIRSALDELFQNRIASSVEVLARHAEVATSDITDCVDETGQIDLKKARETGKSRLIKSITRKSWFDKSKGAEVFEVRVELYSAADARRDLMKYHGVLAWEAKRSKLPKDPEVLLALLKAHIERIRGDKGIRAVPAASPDGKAGN
jgi:hypothetical protein